MERMRTVRLAIACWVAFLLVSLTSSSAISTGKLPHPLDKVKELALRATPDSGGYHNLRIRTWSDEGICEYLFAYTANHGGVVAIGRGCRGDAAILLLYQESSGEMRVWINGVIFPVADKEKALQWAVQVLEEVSYRNLI